MDNTPIRIPIDGVIDLHTFAPHEAPDAVNEYIKVCAQKGITELKIIHGKGKGILRRTVEAALKKHRLVQSFNQDPGPSGWGATIVFLKGRKEQ
jgi:DNA-nicking Smr family endonuclease